MYDEIWHILSSGPFFFFLPYIITYCDQGSEATASPGSNCTGWRNGCCCCGETEWHVTPHHPRNRIGSGIDIDIDIDRDQCMESIWIGHRQTHIHPSAREKEGTTIPTVTATAAKTNNSTLGSWPRIKQHGNRCRTNQHWCTLVMMAIETATPEEVIRTRRQSWMEWIGGEEVTEQGQQYRYYSYSTNEEGIPRMETERCTTTIITTPSIQYNTLSVVIIRVRFILESNYII